MKEVVIEWVREEWVGGWSMSSSWLNAQTSDGEVVVEGREKMVSTNRLDIKVKGYVQRPDGVVRKEL